MSESILLRLASQLNDGTPTGDLLAETAQSRYAASIAKHGNSITIDSPLKYDAGTKALEHMVDTIAYAIRAGCDGATITSLKIEARSLASQIRRNRAEAEAIARAKEVADV